MTAGPCSTPSADNRSGAAPGLYLHIPFCLRKCPYCSFFSVPARPELVSRYLRAMGRQMRQPFARAGMRGGAATVFFGGGTPSLVGVDALVGLLAEAQELFVLPAGAEISVEINPATIGGGDIDRLVDGGFNRISVGVQSLDDRELSLLGRPYSTAEAVECVEAVRAAGCANFNLDLMYGLPGQSAAGWQRTLQRALALGPDHLAIYELTAEPGTPFADRLARGELALPGEEEVLAMHEFTLEATARAGLRRYEISNYARPGRECRHNINYWRNGPYLGLGAGAVSGLDRLRYQAIRDIPEYCRRVEAGEEPWEEVEELDRDGSFRETVVMGLRMTAGVELSELARQFGIDLLDYYGASLDRLTGQGMLEIGRGRVRLTPAGMLLANRVMAELV